MVIFCCMLIGIPIAFVNPTEGGLREEPIIGLFYVSIAGAIIIILYSSMQTRKEQQRLRRERRKTVSYTHLTLPTICSV